MSVGGASENSAMTTTIGEEGKERQQQLCGVVWCLLAHLSSTVWYGVKCIEVH